MTSDSLGRYWRILMQGQYRLRAVSDRRRAGGNILTSEVIEHELIYVSRLDFTLKPVKEAQEVDLSEVQEDEAEEAEVDKREETFGHQQAQPVLFPTQKDRGAADTIIGIVPEERPFEHRSQ